MKLPAYKLVMSQREWQACLPDLQQEPRLAIDLEANSLFAYREQVCLIQISTPVQDYIIDPVADLDLSELGELIAHQEVEKIFHAAEYDLSLLKRQYGWQCHNLFDTMWAARILGYQKYGLANLLKEFFQVNQDKKYQKSNWCRRPLTKEQLTYGQRDTHYLLQLRHHLAAELAEAGYMPEAFELFAEQTQVKPTVQAFDPDGFWSISGAYELPRQLQAVLKGLYAYRDQVASRRNLPLFKVFSDKTLLELAQKSPGNLQQLQSVYGMSNGQIRRYGRQLLSTIAEGKKAPHPRFPRRNKRPPEPVCARYDKLHTWRKEKARARGVESDVILSRDTMWAIARHNPQDTSQLTDVNQLGSWRRSAYGREIVELLTK